MANPEACHSHWHWNQTEDKDTQNVFSLRYKRQWAWKYLFPPHAISQLYTTKFKFKFKFWANQLNTERLLWLVNTDVYGKNTYRFYKLVVLLQDTNKISFSLWDVSLQSVVVKIRWKIVWFWFHLSDTFMHGLGGSDKKWTDSGCQWFLYMLMSNVTPKKTL